MSDFKLKPFQANDLAHAACHDGLILGWDCGTGKSIAGIVWALLKVGVDWALSRERRGLMPLAPVLWVSPESLHQQLCEEWQSKFGIKGIRLDCQDTYLALTDRSRKKLKPGFYYSSYTQLGLNKIKDIPVPQTCERSFPEIAKMMYFFGVTMEDAKARKLTDDFPEGTNLLMEQALAECQHRFKHFSKGVGESKHHIKCIFSPSLADLCGHEFACVVVDEGVRLKSDDSIIGQAVRELDPPYRLVLTGTPVKNRLGDIFWLLWWAAGGKEKPHERFPFGEDDHDKFNGRFLVRERNLTKETQNRKERGITSPRKNKPKGRPGIEPCNLHMLWKVIAPLLLRRRKVDTGEDIVDMTKHVIRVPMGKKQRDVYEYHLRGIYLDKNGDQAIMPKLQALRSVAAAPTSDLLIKLPPEQEGIRGGLHRSDCDYTPKMVACLNVIEQRMRENEQCLVFSAFHEPLDTLSRRLADAGVPHDVLDGRRPAKWRSHKAALFAKGLSGGANPVMLAGAQCMAEGFSFPRCENAILLSFHWALDLYQQAIERIHRLTSENDVRIWPIICQGSIDRKLEANLDEKGDSSELVVDGELIEGVTKELNLRDLLKIAEEDFRAEGDTAVDETVLALQWPALRRKLAQAWSEISTGRDTLRTTSDAAQGHQRPKNEIELVPLETLLKRIEKLKACQPA